MAFSFEIEARALVIAASSVCAVRALISARAAPPVLARNIEVEENHAYWSSETKAERCDAGHRPLPILH